MRQVSETDVIIETRSLCRHYRLGPQLIQAVDHVDLRIERGEFVAVTGSSGSGKSTLLNLLAGLDTPTHGSVRSAGYELGRLSRRRLAAYRAHHVGVVFQAFNLIAHRTALQNVELALYFNTPSGRARRARARDMLAELGLADRLDHRPADLSGGEQQRVAIARALVGQPSILFADEPTGNLDEENADSMARLFSDLHAGGLTIVLVTHDLDLARRYTTRQIGMHYGRIVPGPGP